MITVLSGSTRERAFTGCKLRLRAIPVPSLLASAASAPTVHPARSASPMRARLALPLSGKFAMAWDGTQGASSAALFFSFDSVAHVPCARGTRTTRTARAPTRAHAEEHAGTPRECARRCASAACGGPRSALCYVHTKSAPPSLTPKLASGAGARGILTETPSTRRTARVAGVSRSGTARKSASVPRACLSPQGNGLQSGTRPRRPCAVCTTPALRFVAGTRSAGRALVAEVPRSARRGRLGRDLERKEPAASSAHSRSHNVRRQVRARV
ncbi:hypothetical protein FB451DRAFT_1529014 [Mycena latifolia]|nr:hypothetical protein FB451DRAFT_1529014 [Mycena latifolia]